MMLVIVSIWLHALTFRVTGSLPQSITVVIDLSRAKHLIQVDPRFLSFTIDSHHLIKGWRDFSLKNENLVYLAKSLEPAYLRLGGTDADATHFVPSTGVKTGIACIHGNKGFSNISKAGDRIPWLVPARDFLPLQDFLNNTRLDFIYGLNVLERTGQKWNSTNSLALMKFFEENGIRVAGWELGNEPDSFLHVFNITVPSSVLAHDFEELRRLTREMNVSIIGPDTTRPSGSRPRRYLRGFLKHGGGDVVDSVSIHQYYFDGRTATVKDYLNTTVMDVLKEEIRAAESIISKFAPRKPLWLSETSAGWGGGTLNISDRFVSSFLWMDKLGLAARHGVNVVFRQTLIGGYYGLLNENIMPTPDYYLSLLYKKLVGPQPLFVPSHLEDDRNGDVPTGLRLYFHCAATKNAVTVFGINVEECPVLIQVIAQKKKLAIEQYVLTAPSLTSEFVYLNGVKLVLAPDGKLPTLKPVRKKGSSFIFPPRAVGFWKLERAHVNSRLCTNT